MEQDTVSHGTRNGVPWNKKIAYRHRTAYIQGHGIARDTYCPLCKDTDPIGRILGSCAHSKVNKVYICRPDKAMRLIMNETQNGSLGNFYCTTDVGTAVAMGELGAKSKRLTEWLITPNTLQKCDFSPENEQKLPACIIMETTHDEIDMALKKRTHNGDTDGPTQINGRSRKIWLNELGYSDTRYIDKVIEKKEQHANLCKLLATEGYDVMLFPVVLGSAGTLFKCLDRTTKDMDIPNARMKKLYIKLHLHSIHSLQNLVPPRRYLEKQKPTAEARGRVSRQIASLPTPTCP
jgi:hypothetical protein